MRRSAGFATFTGANGEADEDIILCLKGNQDEGYTLEYAGFRNECKIDYLLMRSLSFIREFFYNFF